MSGTLVLVVRAGLDLDIFADRKVPRGLMEKLAAQRVVLAVDQTAPAKGSVWQPVTVGAMARASRRPLIYSVPRQPVRAPDIHEADMAVVAVVAHLDSIGVMDNPRSGGEPHPIGGVIPGRLKWEDVQ